MIYLRVTKIFGKQSQKRNAIRQCVISTDGCMENCIKLRIIAYNKNATNVQDKA